MARLFGTDGVRGLANVDITAELALRPERRGRPRPGRRGPQAGPPAQGRRRPRPAGLGGVPVRGGHRRAGLGRGRRLRRQRAAHAGHRVPDRRHARRLRRHALGVAQRHARQRHQVLRRRRAQARRRGRGRDRRPPRPGLGAADRRRRGPGRRPCRTATPATSRTCWPSLPNRLDGLTVVIDGAHGAASLVSPEVFRLAGARRSTRSAPSPTASTSTTATAPPTSTTSRRPCSARGADLGIAHDGDADRCLAVDADGQRGRRRPDHGDPGARR